MSYFSLESFAPPEGEKPQKTEMVPWVNPPDDPALMSLEAYTDGVGRVENELVFYAQVPDWQKIDQLSDDWEDQIQYEIRLEQKTRTRVRMTRTKDGTVQFIETMKGRVWGSKSIVPVETELEVTKDRFLQFVWTADRGMVKRRYNKRIPNTPLKWEIDLFYKPMDQRQTPNDLFQPWCKIDLELNPDFQLKQIPPLPDVFGLVIRPGQSEIMAGSADKSETITVSQLYDRYFLWSKENAFPVKGWELA